MTTQLCENERRFLTRRTGIVRQISTPLYRQTVKYLTSDVARRVLVATMWSRVPPEAKYDPMNLVGLVNEGDERIGIANIDIDKLVMRQLIVGWYRESPHRTSSHRTNFSIRLFVKYSNSSHST